MVVGHNAVELTPCGHRFRLDGPVATVVPPVRICLFFAKKKNPPCQTILGWNLAPSSRAGGRDLEGEGTEGGTPLTIPDFHAAHSPSPPRGYPLADTAL